MSKSAACGEFNAAVCSKQSSLQTDPEVYAREKERIWLLILLYDRLLSLMETQNLETVANETCMMDEQPEGRKRPLVKPGQPHLQSQCKGQWLPKSHSGDLVF